MCFIRCSSHYQSPERNWLQSPNNVEIKALQVSTRKKGKHNALGSRLAKGFQNPFVLNLREPSL